MSYAHTTSPTRAAGTAGLWAALVVAAGLDASLTMVGLQLPALVGPAAVGIYLAGQALLLASKLVFGVAAVGLLYATPARAQHFVLVMAVVIQVGLTAANAALL